ncbi:hypothetical protein FK85_07345 [Halorubrum saccharovorum]|uniref:Uncharacterized protein n=1 Tax=Halorubrum saccharovorum TaxID=2248 RepID=A0A081EXG3_9EURY|nr:hypothetical protein FK85_07345 [Halorubrum saccharovorum]
MNTMSSASLCAIEGIGSLPLKSLDTQMSTKQVRLKPYMSSSRRTSSNTIRGITTSTQIVQKMSNFDLSQ